MPIDFLISLWSLSGDVGSNKIKVSKDNFSFFFKVFKQYLITEYVLELSFYKLFGRKYGTSIL